MTNRAPSLRVLLRGGPYCRRCSLTYWILILLALSNGFALAEQRFPPPEFETGHQLPVALSPTARALFLQYIDVAVLFISLLLASWLVYRKRSRKGVVALSLISLFYFGFWRKGCICSIGSLQNVALAFSNTGYSVPLVALCFFLLPLIFTLFGGRNFCAAVCPHGALQDLVLLKPIKVPAWLEHGLGLLPFIYLGAAVLFAATGSAFIICEYDPFVPIFRLDGRALMVCAGIVLLLIGVFVGRPYCRFLCPYGSLLKICSTVSKWRVRVTPDFCTKCRLCEDSCPFGAMREPEVGLPQSRYRLVSLLLLLPLLLAGGGWVGGRFSGAAAMLHPTVRLAERLTKEPTIQGTPSTLSADELALERARQNPNELLTQAAAVRHRMSIGGWIFGAWVGLVIGVKLLSLSIRHRRSDYEPDRGACVACARCFAYCPNERIRRGDLLLPAKPLSATPSSTR